MRLIAWSMSPNAFMRSMPATSSIVTSPRLSHAHAVVSRMPSTPRTASSIGRRMLCSTSSGDPPG